MSAFRLIPALLIAAAPAVAQDGPRSAIPWLSDVIATVPESDAAADAPGPGTVRPFDPNTIEMLPLDLPTTGGRGVLDPAEAGLPATLWAGGAPQRIAGLIEAQSLQGVPEVQRLLRAILLADVTPPEGPDPEQAVLTARLDAMMAAGWLEDARRLSEEVGAPSSALFRRAFDIGLLTGQADQRCADLRASPALDPTLSARTFCLARVGDWAAAELTLSLGERMGSFTRAEAGALARFLDPALYEGQPPPPLPRQMTTLLYVVRDAVGLPRPPGRLPLAFVWLDATDEAPLKTRIEARERLVAANAMDAALLFDAYRKGTPAASGGVWDRMAAVQALDQAFAIGDPAGLAAALAEADGALMLEDLRPALAQVYARQLAAQTRAAHDTSAARRIGQLLLLAGDPAAAVWLDDPTTPSASLLSALAGGGALPEASLLPPFEAALVRGLVADEPPSETAAATRDTLASLSAGERLLTILNDLAPGPETDPGDLTTALWLLRDTDQDAAARRIAAQTLLLLPEA